MQIFVMRHGQAKTIAVSDETRALTQHGIEEAKLMGQWLSKHFALIDCVFVSPYERAQQTAKAVASQLSQLGKVQTLNFITPEDSPKNVHDYLDSICSNGQFERILLISHMPLVSYLVAELTTDNTMPIFQTASIAQIDYDYARMQGELVSLMSPNDMSS